MRQRVRRGGWVLLTVLAVISLGAIGDSTQLIAWSPDTPLTWSCFQGPPPAQAAELSEPAMVSVDIKWAAGHDFDHQFGRTPAWIGTPENIVVSNVLNPTLSWALKSLVTDRLLEHEQGHFDLSEVYCRKLEQSLCGVRATGSSGEAVKAALDQALHVVADPILIQAKKIQREYDLQTSYGRNEAEQARWNHLIETWLEDPLTAP